MPAKLQAFRQELEALIAKHGYRGMHGWDTGAVYVTDKNHTEFLAWPPKNF